MGTFVVFEGIDGAGKSTQIQILHDALVSKGYNPLLTREPGGTPLGETVARWLKSYPQRSPLTELLFFNAIRAEHVTHVIKPALEAGRIVICDRFVASTLAYQGFGRGLDLQLIRQLNVLAAQGLQPSLTVFLDVHATTPHSRIDTEALDVFEKENLDFHQRVRQGFIEIAAEEDESWLVVNGSLEKEAIAKLVWGRVRTLLENPSTP